MVEKLVQYVTSQLFERENTRLHALIEYDVVSINFILRRNKRVLVLSPSALLISLYRGYLWLLTRQGEGFE